MILRVQLAGRWWRIPLWLPLAICRVRAINWQWCADVSLQYALVIAAGVAVVRWAWAAPLAWLFFGTRQAALGVAWA